METVISMLVGAGLMVAAGVVYLGLRKSPAALAAVKTWWTKGKTDLATLKADLADAHLAATSSGSIASDAKSLAASLSSDVAALKARLDKAGIAT